ncbi:hypothetical protein [Piscinibacter sakaiensis]|uniref:hypothetical protein n=1 Tax=Piscinibacter sakaiensis TaxID=1547922 RepID=UPI003AAD072E
MDDGVDLARSGSQGMSLIDCKRCKAVGIEQFDKSRGSLRHPRNFRQVLLGLAISQALAALTKISFASSIRALRTAADSCGAARAPPPDQGVRIEQETQLADLLAHSLLPGMQLLIWQRVENCRRASP